MRSIDNKAHEQRGEILSKSIALKKLSEHPEYCERAALWFSQKWSVSYETYLDSMHMCICQKTGVPQWYIVLDEHSDIIAGAGVIENDFHDRKDLTPNLCALFVEEAYRGQKIALSLLDFAKKDMSNMGYEPLYLVTDHTGFYEKCGWNFLTMVNADDGTKGRMYTSIS